MEFQCTRRDSIGNNVNQTCQEKACDRKYYGSLKCYLSVCDNLCNYSKLFI